MRAGDLRHRIELQATTKASDSMGGFTNTWVTQATVWAGIWPISASEQIQAAQAIMTISHRIRIRYRDNVKASFRIKFGTRYFNIVSIINPSEANKHLDLMVKEAG